MNKIFLSTVLFLFSFNCYAGSWSEALTIESVFTEGVSDIIGIYTSGADPEKHQYNPNCGLNTWVFHADSEDRRNRAFSMAMAALASGKKVSFWYSTQECGAWSYHSATSIKLIK